MVKADRIGIIGTLGKNPITVEFSPRTLMTHSYSGSRSVGIPQEHRGGWRETHSHEATKD